MKKVFSMMFSIGVLILLYTGVTGEFETFIDHGIVVGIQCMFNPFLFSRFEILTFVQDVFLIVGGIGYLVSPKPSASSEFTTQTTVMDTNVEVTNANNNPQDIVNEATVNAKTTDNNPFEN